MIVVDLETTGLDERVCGIASIGAVSWPEGQEFYREIKVDKSLRVEAKALEVNGFTEKALYDPIKPSLDEVMIDFDGWSGHAKDRIIGSWNTNFEIRWLLAAFDKTDRKWSFGYRSMDLHSFAYGMMQAIEEFVPAHNGVGTVGLNYALKWCDLPPEADPHNALTGAKAGLAVYEHMLGLIRGGAVEIEEKPICPKCNTAKMIKRVPKPTDTWNTFWGCSDFPTCDGSRKYIEPKEEEQLELM